MSARRKASRRTLLIVYSSKQFIGSLKSYKDFVMIVIVAAKVCLNCSLVQKSLSNSENTPLTLLLKDSFKRSSAQQRELSAVSAGVGGEGSSSCTPVVR